MNKIQHVYKDVNGNPVYKAERTIYDKKKKNGKPEKKVFPWVFDGEDFRTGSGCMSGVERIPYRLPDLKKTDMDMLVYVEGENKADLLWDLGIPATTHLGGAKAYRLTENMPSTLKDLGFARIAICRDMDDAGAEMALEVAKDFLQNDFEVRWVDIPKPKFEGYDVVDFLQEGHTKEELISVLKNSAPVSDSALSELEENLFSDFKLMKPSQLFEQAEALEKTPFVIESLLASGNFSLLVAREGVGKSTLARYMASEVAKGGSFLNLQCNKGPVFYLAFEESIDNVSDHFKRLHIDDSIPLYIFCSEKPEGIIEKLKVRAERIKPSLIVIDVLGEILNISDGNSYHEVTRVLQPIRQIARDTGAHLMALHHSNKTTERGMGTDSILGSVGFGAKVDLVMVLRRLETGQRTFEVAKARGLGKIQRFDETIWDLDEKKGTVSLGRTKEEIIVEEIMAEFRQMISVNAIMQSELYSQVSGPNNLKKLALDYLEKMQEIEMKMVLNPSNNRRYKGWKSVEKNLQTDMPDMA